MHTYFYSQWFYALMVGEYGLLDAARLTGNDEYQQYFIDSIGTMADFYEQQKNNPVDYQMPDIVTRTMMYIMENYENKLSLEELASKSNCSVTYLSRIFKRYVGLTVYNYIIATRISNAQIMLKENMSVTETCFACGFDDCSNFIRTFKKNIGKTPMQFQKGFGI